jgi:hypothetical protein
MDHALAGNEAKQITASSNDDIDANWHQHHCRIMFFVFSAQRADASEYSN